MVEPAACVNWGDAVEGGDEAASSVSRVRGSAVRKTLLSLDQPGSICMDRLLFASEDVRSEVADMYPASHEGEFDKLIFHRCFSRASVAWRGSVLVQG